MSLSGRCVVAGLGAEPAGHEAVVPWMLGRRCGGQARKSELIGLTSKLLLVHGRCLCEARRVGRRALGVAADQRFEDPALQLVKQAQSRRYR